MRSAFAKVYAVITMVAEGRQRVGDDNDVGPRPVRFNFKEFAVLVALLAAAGAWGLLGPAEETELLTNCPGWTGENFAPDPREVRDDLGANLAASGFVPTGPAPDATAGWESAMFRGHGVVVTLRYHAGAYCPRHRTAKRRMDWKVEGPGGRVAWMQSRVREWVAASKADAGEQQKV